MKLVDYTGKMNAHDAYLEMLKRLERKSRYIEYVLVDETDTEFIEKFRDLCIEVRVKNRWWGRRREEEDNGYIK